MKIKGEEEQKPLLTRLKEIQNRIKAEKEEFQQQEETEPPHMSKTAAEELMAYYGEDELHFSFDTDKLQHEIQYQPSLMARVSKIYAQKIKYHEVEECKLNALAGELSKDIRRNPKKYGLLPEGSKKEYRVTDTQVKNILCSLPEYKEQHLRFAEAKEAIKQWEGMFKAAEQRGWAIKLAFEMWAKDYYNKMEIRNKQEH